jgi:hypothetical protein
MPAGAATVPCIRSMFQQRGYGLKPRYAHLLSVAVAKDQRIAKGAILGGWDRPARALVRISITMFGTTTWFVILTAFCESALLLTINPVW